MLDRYIKFISENKTEREVAKSVIREAEKNGFLDIEKIKELKSGDKCYMNVHGKALILFRIGKENIENGMLILGAHIDSPRLDLKMRPLYEKGGIVYLNTHYYGGIKKYQWLTGMLAIHGTVVKKDGEKIDVVMGEESDEFTFSITDILPHVAHEQMKKTAAEFVDGEDLDLIVALGKEGEKDAGKNNVLSYLEKKYGFSDEDFASAELEVVPSARAKYLGPLKDMVIGYGQDDRVCAFTSMEAFFESDNEEKTLALVLADKEEIGSDGSSGMNGLLLENAVWEVLSRLSLDSGVTFHRAMRNSMMLSSDVNSAYDPLNASLFDEMNSSKLGCGFEFNKYTGARGKAGASDADAEFVAKIRKALDEDGVPYQMAELSKVDVGGGGTIAKYASRYGMNVIDAGVAVMSMHAPYEITSTEDIKSAKKAYAAFLKIGK